LPQQQHLVGNGVPSGAKYWSPQYPNPKRRFPVALIRLLRTKTAIRMPFLTFIFPLGDWQDESLPLRSPSSSEKSLLTVYPSRASHRGTAATVRNIKKASKPQYHFFTTAPYFLALRLTEMLPPIAKAIPVKKNENPSHKRVGFQLFNSSSSEAAQW
jgi:hypothetical protein